jgi:iron(III) transport system ATP-binding protein
MGDASTLPGLRGADGVVRLDALDVPDAAAGTPGPVQVAVRPEAWRLAHAREPGLAGTVAQRCYHGRLMEYRVETPLGAVWVHVPYRGARLECGAPVSLQIAPGGAAWVLP